MARQSADEVLRVRRHQPTRLEGFVDSSFAFAVTVLVISIGHVPTSVPEMLHALRGLPTFAICFLLIARIWKTHRNWSRHYDLEDERALVLSLMLVFVVLVFVYPLRLLFAFTFSWLSGGFLEDLPLSMHSVDELRWAYEVYGFGFGAIAGLFALLFQHALCNGARIGLDSREVLATRMYLRIWLVFAGIAGASALLAATLPFSVPFLAMIPGLLYALMGAAAGAIRRRYTRRIAAEPVPT